MDVFETLRSFQCVTRVSNLRDTGETLDFVFYLCPSTKARMQVNQLRTGLTTQYRAHLSSSLEKRIERVREFACEASMRGVSFTLTAIFANADAYILFPIPVKVPPVPVTDFGLPNFRMMGNASAVMTHLEEFSTLYSKKPWESISGRLWLPEVERLRVFVPSGAPENVRDDYVQRIFAGFALDGVLIRNGAFGTPNPVILGVESEGVAVLQNAALEKKDRIPLVQLR